MMVVRVQGLLIERVMDINQGEYVKYHLIVKGKRMLK